MNKIELLCMIFGGVILCLVLYKYYKNNSLNKGSYPLLIIGFLLLTFNQLSVIRLSTNAFDAELLKKVSNIQKTVVSTEKRIHTLESTILESAIEKIEIHTDKFDEKAATEKIEMLLLNKEDIPKAYLAKSDCEKMTNYKNSYKFKNLEFKDKSSYKMITVCQKAVDYNKKSFIHKLMLAVAYHKNLNYKKTVEIITELAKKDYSIAQRKLAFIYLLGNITKKDITKAKKWLFKAAENGDLAAQEIINRKVIKF